MLGLSRVGLERERPAQRDGGRVYGQMAEPVRHLRCELLDQCRHAFKRPRIEVERDGAAWRLRPGIDASLGSHCDTAEIRDDELINVEPVAIDLHLHVGLLHLDSAGRNPTDLQRQGASVRPIELGVVGDRLGDCINSFEINLGRRQRCV